MSFVGSLFGAGSGSGFQAGGQNISNLQTDTANAENTQGQQQGFLSALAAQGGAQNQTNVFQQQQALSNQLAQQAAGGGPNPALQQLQNTTGQNVANQAALAAGQRGAGANAGLIARQVGQQGAATQQQAAGQGAVMASQQQLNAQGQLANQQANMANLATQQVGQQANTLQNLAGNSAQLQGNDINSINGQNSTNGAIAQGNQKTQQGILGGATNAVAGILGSFAEGGEVAPVAVATPDAPSATGPKSKSAQLMNGSMATTDNATKTAEDSTTNLANSAIGAIGNAFGSAAPAAAPSLAGGGDDITSLPGTMFAAKGGKVPAMVSPGEVYIPPSKVKEAAKSKDPTKHGEKIPGRASVKGDSLKNDTVPKTLEEGGIVLPKSVMEHKHPAWAAHKFVTAITAKTKLRKK